MTIMSVLLIFFLIFRRIFNPDFNNKSKGSYTCRIISMPPAVDRNVSYAPQNTIVKPLLKKRPKTMNVSLPSIFNSHIYVSTLHWFPLSLLTCYLTPYNLLNLNQSVYAKHRFTETVFAITVSKLAMAIRRNSLLCVFFKQLCCLRCNRAKQSSLNAFPLYSAYRVQ